MTTADHPAEVHPSLKIPAVCVVFARTHGENDAVMISENSAEVFRVLENAAFLKIPVKSFAIDGREIDADSLGALNAYLRTPRALNWNGILPFSRIVRHPTRWGWKMFLAYLDVTFAK